MIQLILPGQQLDMKAYHPFLKDIKEQDTLHILLNTPEESPLRNRHLHLNRQQIALITPNRDTRPLAFNTYTRLSE
jgi:hypothetical protein